MSTKKYGLVAALLLITLSSIASATIVSTNVSWTGERTINDLYPDGTLDIVAGGSVTFNDRVNLRGTENVPCQIIMSGGTFYNLRLDKTLNVTDKGTAFRERIYVNAGTMTCGDIKIEPGRNGKIIVGGGTLIILQNYNGADINKDPLLWATDGRLVAAPGYELVYKSPAPDYGIGSVKITAVRSSFNPVPAENGFADSTQTNLCWDSYDAKIYKVYLGTAADANESNYAAKLALLGNSGTVAEPNVLTNLCYSLTGALTVPQNYTWALAAYGAVDGGGLPTGSVRDVKVYKFQTTTNPLIVTQPVTAATDFGGTAVLTTKVQSALELGSWDWYQFNGTVYTLFTPVAPNTNVKTDLGSYQYQITLTVNGIDTGAEQGRFICRPTNSAGSTDTAIVNIVSKGELAHWNFEDDLLDSSPKNAINSAVANATATVLPAVYAVGNQLDLRSLSFTNGQYLTISGFGNFRAGMTIAAYFKMNTNDNKNSRIIELANANPTQTIYIAHSESCNSELTFFSGGTRGAEVEEGIRLGNAFDLNVWSHLVVTMDKTGVVKFYKNGFLVETLSTPAQVPVQAGRSLSRIGWNQAGSLPFKFNGSIGDLRIYNYPISENQVRDLWVGVNGPFCVELPDLDLDGNCRVDLSDFAAFAASWLQCGKLPVSACP